MILWIFLFFIGWHSLYFLLIHWSVSRLDHQHDSSAEGVSVLICFHNELDNLKHNITHWLNQEYAGPWELLLVDDSSIDGSLEYVQGLAADYPRIHILKHAKDTPGKRGALTAGILMARYDWILCTDADCHPVSPYWIDRMMCGRSQARIVQGFGAYIKSLACLTLWMRYESMMIALESMFWATARKPYMLSGRNYLIHREEYTRRAPLQTASLPAGGDDDLFLHTSTRRPRVRAQTDAQSLTYSRSYAGWSDYFKAKARHLSAGKQYRLSDQWRVALPLGAHAGWIITGLMAISAGYAPWVLLGVGMRWILLTLSVSKLAIRWRHIDVLVYYPLWDLIRPVISLTTWMRLRTYDTSSW